MSAPSLYVASTGDDANDCTNPLTPALTIQHAVDVAEDGAAINVGAGTFNEAVIVDGRVTLTIIGAGSAATLINADSSKPSGAAAITAANDAKVFLGSLKLSSQPASGSCFLMYENATGSVVDDDVVFAGADRALIYVTGKSSFNATLNGSHKITIAGSADYALLASTQSNIITGSNVTNVVSGNPAFTAFVDLIGGSFYNKGINSQWSGTATGARYAITLNSFIDTEQDATPLPGDSPGTCGSGSYYYTNADLVTVAGTSGSRESTPAPTGFGTGATFIFQQGSGDQSGMLQVKTGSAPAASGVVGIVTPSIMKGPINTGAAAIACLSNAGSTWDADATARAYYNSSGVICISWSNNGVPLLANHSYNIGYSCN